MVSPRTLCAAPNVRTANAVVSCLRNSTTAPRAAVHSPPSTSSSTGAALRRHSVAFSTRTFASSASTPRSVPVNVPTPDAKPPRGRTLRDASSLLGNVLDSSPKPTTALRPIYLDSQSTTALDPRVLDTMLPFLTNRYGNPHSRTHAYGWEAEEAVETARKNVGALIGADAKEIIFTSGATESNNLALKGATHFYGGKKNHIITVQTEHKCVLDSCRTLQEEGYQVTYLPVQSNGLIRLADLEAALRPTTAIVSIMSVNNEIGVIQPLKEIGQLLKTKGAALSREAGLSGKPFLHTDAAQAVGKIPLDVNEIGVDLMSMSSHKIYGPMGIGAIYIRRRPRVRLTPIISGGGQERGLRSGTLAPALVVGMGEAARLAKAEREYDYAHVKALSERLRSRIEGKVSHVLFNGDQGGYPGCVNLTFQYVEGESLLMALKRVCLSSGSACTSASLEPSYVLRALGLNDENAHSSLRFGLGRFTTTEEVDYVADQIISVVQKLRDMSPLWEMVQEGIDLDSIQWSE